MKLAFRPHHFLCTLAFAGKGYSPKFIKNYWDIVKFLEVHDDLPIEVTSELDTICMPCPKRKKNICGVEKKVQLLDALHSQALNIFPGDILTWAEAKVRIKEKMAIAKFHTVCSGCQWKPLGICEKALKKHRGEA